MKKFIFLKIVFFIIVSSVFANPKNGAVEYGNVEFSSFDNVLNIKQNSDRAIVNWREFSIDENEITKIIQKDANSAILNRVTGFSPSYIYGNLTSNGKIFLINENGIVIGPSGVIKASSFIGSCLNLENENFLKGEFHFEKGNGKIINNGKIASDNYVLLLGNEIVNKGDISSNRVSLAAADMLLIDKNETIGAVRLKGSIDNQKDIKGFLVELMSGEENIYSLAINHSGLIESSKTILNGENGKVKVTGIIKGDENSEKTCQIIGRSLELSKESFIDMRSGGKVSVFSDDDCSFNGTINSAETEITAKNLEYRGIVKGSCSLTAKEKGLFEINALQNLTINGGLDSTLLSNLPNSSFEIKELCSSLNTSIVFSNISNIETKDSSHFNIFASLNSITTLSGINDFIINGGKINSINGSKSQNSFFINGGKIVNLFCGSKDVIKGPPSGASWNITSVSSGNITDYIDNFFNVNALIGANEKDIFIVSSDIDTINMNGGAITIYNGKISHLQNIGSGVFNICGGEIKDLISEAGSNTYNINAGVIENLVGSGNDTIVGPSSGALWYVTKEKSGSIPDCVLSFSGVNNLKGSSEGNSVNNFYILENIGKVNMGGGTNSLELSGTIHVLSGDSGTNSYIVKNGTITNFIGGTKSENITLEKGFIGTLNMGANDNSLTILDGEITTVNGNTGSNKYFIKGGKIGNLIGGNGVDEIIGPPNSSWNLGHKNGSIEGHLASFSDIDILTGSGNDSFLINTSATVAKINLSEGKNSVHIINGRVEEINAKGSNSFFVEGGYVGILNGSGEDELMGPGNSSWYVCDEGKIDNVVGKFKGITTLNGRQNDKFVIDGSSISRINLGGGENTLEVNGEIENVYGSSGNNTYFVRGEIKNLIGGSGFDTICGPNGDVNWNITGSNQGNIFPHIKNFSSIDKLIGGKGQNIFVFENVVFEGSIQGNKESILDFSSFENPIVIDLQNKSATPLGKGYFDNIDQIIGPSNQANKLIGSNRDTTWTKKDGFVIATEEKSSMCFSGFENLRAGKGKNTFVFADEILAKQIEGSFGACTLDFSQFGPITVDLAKRFIEEANLSFSNIQKIIANKDASNTLIGSNGTNIWKVTGKDSGSFQAEGFFFFENVGNLKGGSGSDTFIFKKESALSGKVDGGSDRDNTLDYSNYDGITIDLEKRSASNILDGKDAGFINIQNFIGSSKNDTLIGPNLKNTWKITNVNEGEVNNVKFKGITNLKGGNISDRFVFSDGAGVSGNIDGSDGEKSFDFSAFTSPAILNLKDQLASNLGGFINISIIVGNYVLVLMDPSQFIAKEILFDTEVTLSMQDAIRSRIYLNPYYTINYNVFSPDLMKIVDPEPEEKISNLLKYEKQEKPKKKVFYWFK